MSTERDSESEQSAYEWVLQDAEENARAKSAGPWTSEDHLLQQGVKPKNGGFSRDEIKDAISQALVQNELIGWHGLLARTTEEKLREIIEAEKEADITRQILIGKVNRYIKHLHREGKTDAELEQGTSETEVPA